MGTLLLYCSFMYASNERTPESTCVPASRSGAGVSLAVVHAAELAQLRVGLPQQTHQLRAYVLAGLCDRLSDRLDHAHELVPRLRRLGCAFGRLADAVDDRLQAFAQLGQRCVAL